MTVVHHVPKTFKIRIIKAVPYQTGIPPYPCSVPSIPLFVPPMALAFGHAVKITYVNAAGTGGSCVHILQAEAERRLLRAALQDPRNQRFVLLSESCAPLYPPHVIYLQLLGEARSRLNACLEPGKLADRWAGGLAEGQQG